MTLYVFSSNSCIPCRTFKENLKKNHIEFKEKNFDTMTEEERIWAGQFKIRALPTTIIFENGDSSKIKEYLIGTVPIEKIKSIMNK